MKHSDAAFSRLAHPGCLAHALRRLEFDLARDQDRVARSATGFVRRLAIRDRDGGSLVISVGRTRLLPRSRSDYLVLGFTGLLMFSLNYTLLFWAELHVSSGLAAVIQASIPIFGMICAHWMLPDEPLRWQRLVGALVAIFGVAIDLRATAQLQRLAGVSRRARDHDRRRRAQPFPTSC